MSRINTVNKENADPKALEILTSVNKALGIVPNMIATMAQSPAVANAYVGFNHALSQGSLSAKIRERIALSSRRRKFVRLLPCGAHVSRCRKPA